MVLDITAGTLFPLSYRVAILETKDSKFFLTDGNRFVEYPSFEDALETKITNRKLFFGEKLPLEEKPLTVVVLEETSLIVGEG